MHEDIQEILFSEEEIAARVRELGQAITAEYAEDAKESPIVVVSVLRGAAIFMADLVREIKLPIEMDFMAVSSYGNAAKSSGNVKILKDLSTDIRDRHVIIAEDIVDSGLTLSCLIELLKERGPKSISIVALLRKKETMKVDIDCKLVGFDCPNKFVAGYGLDYAEHYRNLPYIGALKPEVYE